MIKANKENDTAAKAVPNKADAVEQVAAKPAKAEGYVYLITRSKTEGEWKPEVEIVKAGDPRAVVGPDSMVLPHPGI